MRAAPRVLTLLRGGTRRAGLCPRFAWRSSTIIVMAVEANVLRKARKYKSSAVEELFESYYPTVFRLAHSLCGQQPAARRVIDRVLKQALAVMPRWRDDSDSDRWFYHYTVLETRRND